MATGNRKPLRINLEEAKQSLESHAAGADAARANNLAELRRIRTVKTAAMERERERLKAKYGADHPGVVQLGNDIGVGRRLERTIRTEVVRAKMDVPKADPGAWVVLGHVRDGNRAGMPGLTVGLFDEKGVWIKESGYACTDDAGYFKLAVARPAPAPPPKDGERPPPVSDSGRPVFVRVLDRERTILFKDAQPTIPFFGTIVYREIIRDQAPPCVPPEKSADDA